MIHLLPLLLVSIRESVDNFIDEHEVGEDDAASIKAVVADVIEPAFEAIDEVTGDGLSVDEAIELVSQTIDAALPLNALLPGALGAAAEANDGPAVKAALTALVNAFKPDPDAIVERANKAAEKGKDKRAERLFAKADKVAARQAI